MDPGAWIGQDPYVNQIDVNRVRVALATALAPDSAPGVVALVYARSREAVRVLVAETRLAAEFEALFPVAYLELGAAPGYPDLLCRQLEAWLAEVDAAREARVLTPELALVDDSLRDGGGASEPTEPEPDEPDSRTTAHVASPPGASTPIGGDGATAHFFRIPGRKLTIEVAFLLAVAALILVISLHH